MSAERVRILVVEDNALNMDLMNEVLVASNFCVLQARDAESALAMALAERPALILMDMALPGMNGLDATRWLKGDPRTSMIPVIIVTAHAMRRDEERAIAVGCDRFLTKPIDTRALAAVVRAVIAESLPAGAAARSPTS